MSLDAKRVEQLFASALQLTQPAARAQLLDRECGADPGRQSFFHPRWSRDSHLPEGRDSRQVLGCGDRERAASMGHAGRGVVRPRRSFPG